jgi:hypothetical protein
VRHANELVTRHSSLVTPLNLPPFSGRVPPSRRKFWEAARSAVLASQKKRGHNTTTSEHPGKGTIINVASDAERRPGPTPPPPDCTFSASLQCVSASASKSKCGHAEFIVSNPPKIYRVFTGTYTFYVDGPSCRGGVTCWAGVDAVLLKTYTYDDDCILETVITPADEQFDFTRCFGEILHTGLGFLCTPVIVTATNKHCLNVITITDPRCTIPETDQISTGDETLSDEYTTDMLKENTIAALPGYPAFPCDPETLEPGQGCNCEASATLSEDESSYSLQRFRYKWTFSAPSTGCTLRWHEVEYDELDNLVASVARSYVVTPGTTETPVYEVLEPETSAHYIVIEQP